MSELTPQARAFLKEHRGDGEPSAEDAERVRAAIDASLAGAAGFGTVAVVKKLSLVKVFVLAVGLGAASTLVVKKVVVATTPPPQAQRVRPLRPAVPVPTPPAVVEALAPTEVAIVEPEPVVQVVPKKLAAVSPTVQAPVEPAPTEPTPAVAVAPNVEREAPAPTIAPPMPKPDELWLVKRAQALLQSGKQNEALDVLGEWNQHYGERGQFGEEARAAQVIAMCELGHVDARAEATRYLERYPASLQRNRVERACSR